MAQTNLEGFFDFEAFLIGVPEKYECRAGFEAHSACAQDSAVYCWVSRPREKTVSGLGHDEG